MRGIAGCPLVLFHKKIEVVDSWNIVWDILSQIEAIRSQFCP